MLGIYTPLPRKTLWNTQTLSTRQQNHCVRLDKIMIIFALEPLGLNFDRVPLMDLAVRIGENATDSLHVTGDGCAVTLPSKCIGVITMQMHLTNPVKWLTLLHLIPTANFGASFSYLLSWILWKFPPDTCLILCFHRDAALAVSCSGLVFWQVDVPRAAILHLAVRDASNKPFLENTQLQKAPLKGTTKPRADFGNSPQQPRPLAAPSSPRPTGSYLLACTIPRSIFPLSRSLFSKIIVSTWPRAASASTAHACICGWALLGTLWFQTTQL